MSLTVHSRKIWDGVKEHVFINALTLLVLVIVMMMATAYATNKIIGQPLYRLRKAMNQEKESNVREPVQWDSQDEIGQVVRAFNELQRQQAEAEDALRRNKDELEYRVVARTKEAAMKTELLKAVLDSLSDGIVAFDKDLQLIAANDRLHDIRGYPREMITEGRPFKDFIRFDVANEEFGPGDPEKIIEEKIKKANQFLPHDFERQRPNGHYIEVRGGPIPGGGFVST
jgi:PAS domain-containing protein